MNSLNIGNNKINRHIIIKRRKKKENETHMRDLTFKEHPKLNLIEKKEIKIDNNRKISNFNNFSNNTINFDKLISLHIPKVKINLYTI